LAEFPIFLTRKPEQMVRSLNLGLLLISTEYPDQINSKRLNLQLGKALRCRTLRMDKSGESLRFLSRHSPRVGNFGRIRVSSFFLLVPIHSCSKVGPNSFQRSLNLVCITSNRLCFNYFRIKCTLTLYSNPQMMVFMSSNDRGQDKARSQTIINLVVELIYLNMYI
jgi:hypothetical protein